MLTDSESDNDGEKDLNQLTINEHYAKAFEYRKEREEFQRLKETYGSDAGSDDEEETDSEDLESEDSDGDELTPAMDAAILRTLARIKSKDPAIYQSDKKIFDEEQEHTSKSALTSLSRSGTRAKQPKEGKPLTIREVNLQNALNSRSPSPEAEQPVTHVEEQRRLRDETIAAFGALDKTGGNDADDNDDWLVPRQKSMDEIEREEEEYRQFLETEAGNLRDLIDVAGETAVVEVPEDTDEETSGKKDKKKKKKKKKVQAEDLQEGSSKTAQDKQAADQEFLVNYILNRGWIDRSAKRLPTYNEITGLSKKGKSKAVKEPEHPAAEAQAAGSEPDEAEEEEIFDDIIDRFESSYNFRFEEPDGADIKAYPRNLTSTVRREDTTRKDARERRKQRKEEELAKRKEDVRRMKGLKMKEIRSRLERAGVNTGEVESLAELGIDLDAPWDPEAHEKHMSNLYGLNGEEDDDSQEKPIWDDDVDIGDIYVDPSYDPAPTKKEKKKKKKKDAEEEDGVDVDAMDADAAALQEADDEEWDGTEEMRKRKLKEWMDEIDAMDFNDIVGGMPTRFHYTTVAPQNYALSATDILMAKDAELNEYMGMKKLAPYRKGDGWDANRGEKLQTLKSKIKERTGWLDHGHGDASNGPVKKRKGKKERLREEAAAAATEDTHEVSQGKRKRDEEGVEEEAPTEAGKKRRKRKKKDDSAAV